MRQVFAEKTPGEDLPFYFDFAADEGDARDLFVPNGTESIASQTITDWNGSALTDITVADSNDGAAEMLLRISGGVLNSTKYIRARITTSPAAYKLDLIIELYIRHPKVET